MNKLIILILPLLLAISSGSFACACAGSGEISKESISRTKFVAVIQILAVDTIKIKHESSSRPFHFYAKYTARLIQKFKEFDSSDVIFVYSTLSDCEYVFKPGLKYILFADSLRFKDPGNYSGSNNLFETSFCSPTTSYNESRVRAIKDVLKPRADKVVPVNLY